MGDKPDHPIHACRETQRNSPKAPHGLLIEYPSEMKKTPKKKPAHISGPQNEKKRHWLYVFLILVTGLLAYSNSYDCSFHLDDISGIVENEKIRFLNLGDILGLGLTRFLVNVSFSLNYILHGAAVGGYHIVNVLIHLSTALVVFSLARTILMIPRLEKNISPSQRDTIALATGLLFVAHPLATQSVTYIVQRLAAMAALFYLLSLWLYIQGRITSGRESRLYLTGAFLAGIGALLSKENAYTLPGIIGLTEWVLLRSTSLKDVFRKPTFWVISGGMVLLVLIAVSQMNYSFFVRKPDLVNEYREITPVTYLLTQFTVIPKYIQLLVFPASLNLDYDWPLYHSPFEWPVWFGIILISLALGFGILRRLKNPIVAFSIFFFFITLSVESSFVPIDDLIFEHRTYLPSFGFFFLLCFSAYRLHSHIGKTASLALLVGVTLALTLATWQRNKTWKNEITLWRDVLKKSPEKGRPNYALATALYKELNSGNPQESASALLVDFRHYAWRAHQKWPLYDDPKKLLGYYYYQAGKYDSAYYFQSQLIGIPKETLENKVNVIKTLNKLQRYDESIPLALDVLEKDSLNEVALFGLALAYTNKKDLDRGVAYFLKLIEIYPQRKDALEYASQLLRIKGRIPEADELARRAADLK